MEPFQEKNLSRFSFQDSSTHTGCNTYLGGSGDVARLRYVIRENIKKNPQVKIELFGSCRGALTILNYLAAAPEEELRHIVGVIVESPPDNPSVFLRTYTDRHIQHAVKNYHWTAPYITKPFSYLAQKIINLLPTSLTNKLLSVSLPNCSNWNGNVLDRVHQIPKKLPILFICLEGDTVVPDLNTKRIYTKMQALGHDVSMSSFEDGTHGRIIDHSSVNYQKYRNILEEFRAQYPQNNA